MKHYVEQLIEDINEAMPDIQSVAEQRDDIVGDDETFFKHIENVEKYLYGEEKPISTITGIDFILLPPPEKLTTEQQRVLSVELEKLLLQFHFELDFPKNYPAHLRYPFIKKFWEENHTALTFGASHIEFCSYEIENCPFPGYCKTCEEIDAQMKHDEEQANNSGNNKKFRPGDIPFKE